MLAEHEEMARKRKHYANRSRNWVWFRCIGFSNVGGIFFPGHILLVNIFCCRCLVCQLFQPSLCYSEDEYAGLMSQRDKQWIINIQLNQLKCDNPYVDDYYYTMYQV